MAAITEKSKTTNTFRFKSFSDRVNEIDLRRLALYHIGHKYEELEDSSNETFFQQTLQKWTVLNLTEEYNYFSKRCRKIVTLPQLLHQKDFVVDLLLERLATATNLSQQPLLELLYVLARDLREEFYPYFQRVLDRLICLLNTQDAEQLEWTLICLAYLFKALKPYLKRNIGVVFNAILPLLDEQHYAEHVTNFAVECFAYIARDVRDFPRFLDYVLQTVLREQMESVHGCGRLLFEIWRGVNGQLHTCAGELLEHVLKLLANSEEKYTSEQTSLLTDILQHTIGLLLQFLLPDQSGVLWQKLCGIATATPQIVSLMLPLVTHKDGRYVAELQLLIPTILQMLDCHTKDAEALPLLSTMVSRLLLARQTQLSQLDANRLLNKMLAVSQCSRSVYEEFIMQLVDYQQFELLVLPHVIAHYEQKQDTAATELLARIVLHKQPLHLDASSLDSWRVYPLQLKQSATIANVEKKLKRISLDSEDQCLLLVLAPHLRGFSKEPLADSLQVAIATEEDHKMLLLLLQTHALLKFTLPPALRKKLLASLLPVLRGNILALASLQLVISKTPKNDLKSIDAAVEAVAPLLSQSHPECRRIAAHCLQLLCGNPYGYFYAASCIEPTVHNYREILLQLQQLETSSAQFKQYEQQYTHFKEHVVSLLLGLLYYNFKFLWAPVQQLLAAYVKVMPVDSFWNLYKAKLLLTTESINCNRKLNETAVVNKQRSFDSIALNSLLPIADSQQEQLTLQQSYNYRQLLWQCLPKLGNLAEIKNADLVRMFLSFVENEYRAQLECTEHTWNLNETNADIVEDNEEDDKEEAEAEEEETKRPRRQQKSQTAKFILQTLQLKLACFAHQPNPKAIHRQAEMHEFYLELLAGPNAQLQQLALDCLAAYKQPAALLQYKEQLGALIDEAKFKVTLTSFELEKIESERRVELIPFMLRVLYGKMLTKGTQRQVNAQQRKTLILRFLGQLEEGEILSFLQMTFGRFANYTAQSIEQLPNYVRENHTPTAVVAARQLHRVVNLLELIRKEFGGRMSSDFQVYVLKLLLFAGSVCQQVLEDESCKLATAYKNVRLAALNTLVNYFAHLQDMRELWQVAPLEAICEVFVWPSVARLPQDSIHTPTPLLKLLLLWGAEPRFHYLLGRGSDEDSPCMMHYLIALLMNEKTKSAVRKPLMQLIEQLLECAATEEYGEQALSILRPHIPDVLKRLQGNWKQLKRNGSLDKCELNILTLLTAYVEEPATCEMLLNLLLPIFIRQATTASVEVVTQFVKTLTNLCHRVEKPHEHVGKLAPLFELVHALPARKMLCELMGDLAKKLNQQAKKDAKLRTPADSLREEARIVLLLNAWDKRWLEQPDFDRRLQALNEMKTMVEEKSVPLELGVLTIYNCFYMLRHVADLGMRVNIGELLKVLLPHLVQKTCEESKEQLAYLMDVVLLPLLQRSIREDRYEHARTEAIGLIGELARQCPTTHEVLRDLAPLADKHDMEVDFFENMLHLQTQRHGRGLQHLCKVAGGSWRQSPPGARTLTQFLLPLATRYLLTEKHIGKHTLIDAAIEAVGVMCEFLPWHNYHTVLRHYLQKLRHSNAQQKQCVRIVVRVLDAFHFDLSLAQATTDDLEQLKQKLSSVKEEQVKEEQQQQQGEIHSKEEDGEEGEATANIDFEEEEEEGEESTVVPVAARSSQQLTASAARRVMTTITGILLPTLNRAITEKTNYDQKHKVNRKRLSFEREEEEIQRVPIALAMVKLLQKLPKELLDSSLSGIFMKVCTFLRSPLKSVRMLTRDILKKIILTLGGSYLGRLLEQLQSLLTRGFQVHVLSVTLHGVLDALRSELQPEHIEQCLQNLLEVALNDIFGDVSAEKEVDKIVAHTPEAKPSAKSYEVLHIAARHIRDNCLLDLLMPFKDHLARTQSRKVTMKIQECFGKIVSGLVENQHVARESLLIFIYGIVSESITDLLPGTKKVTLSKEQQELMRRARPDALLLQPIPGRRSVTGSGGNNKTLRSNAQANAHILIEFGLELLHFVLKRKKLSELDYQPFLQPLLPLFADSLRSKHARTTTYALKCYTAIWLGDYELVALGEEQLQPLVARMFEILQNFSTFGAMKQEENAHLVRASFKAVVALLRKCENYTLTAEQVEQLLIHIEQELQEGEASSQTMCFTLLRAIVGRKVDTKALHDLMQRLGEQCIISTSDYIRDQSREILLFYIMEYPLQNRVEQIVKFMSVQLTYSQPAGRQSAIKFMHAIINRFPHQVLMKHSEFLYLSLGARLVNDDDVGCRRSIAAAVEALLSRLTKLERQPLLDLTLLFFTSQQARLKPGVREMAASMLSRFVQTEKASFMERLPLVLPILVGLLTIGDVQEEGRFVRAPGRPAIDADDLSGVRNKRKRKQSKGGDKDEDLEIPEITLEERQRNLDHQLIQVQYCLLKIFDNCGDALMTNTELCHTVDELAYGCQRLLGHDHNWVRCNAAKLLTEILARYDYAFVGQRLSKCASVKLEDKHLDFIYARPAEDIKSLVLDLCAQVIPGETAQEMIDEMVKIFLFIANMLRDVPFNLKEDKEVAGETKPVCKIHLSWLVRNIRNLINKEVTKAQHATNIRTALFTLIEGLITLLSVETVTQLASPLLQSLVREMSEEDQNVDSDLRQLALRVGSRLRKRIGLEVYDKLRNVVQTKLMVRRADRKKVVAQEKIHDPIRAAKRKAGVQERKKLAKRVKTAVVRGKAADTKNKLKKRKRKAQDEHF